MIMKNRQIDSQYYRIKYHYVESIERIINMPLDDLFGLALDSYCPIYTKDKTYYKTPRLLDYENKCILVDDTKLFFKGYGKIWSLENLWK